MRRTSSAGPAPDFSERDRALLTLLCPHLHLLHLLAAGHTNAQIARRLGLSEGTVRIHLENIYSRLQVSNRTAGVTRTTAPPSQGCRPLAHWPCEQQSRHLVNRNLPRR